VLFPEEEQAVGFLAAGTSRRPGPERLARLEASEKCRNPCVGQGIEEEPIPPEAGDRYGELIGEEPLLFPMSEEIGAVLGEGGESERLEATAEATANSPRAKPSPS
jgi:hypothetical protein